MSLESGHTSGVHRQYASLQLCLMLPISMKVRAGNALLPTAIARQSMYHVCTMLSYFNECHIGRKNLMVNQGQLAKISRLQAHLAANY